MNVARKILNFTIKPTDSESVRINKSVLMFTVVFKCIGCVLWCMMYYSLGFALAWKFPLVYLGLLILTSLYLYVTNNLSQALNFYMIFVLIVPASLQVAIGGFVNSGAVVIWSLLAPTGALFFKGEKHGIAWFAAYVLLMVFLAIYESTTALDVQNDEITIRLFFLMNLGVVTSFMFYTMIYYRKLSTKAHSTILDQKDQLQSVNEKLNKQKLKIEEQHNLLLEQHNELTEEKKKTQNMLHKIETLFDQQVSEEVAQELVSSNGEFNSKVYEVTVMFLDIRDFTSFADSREPSEVAAFQNVVFSELIDIIRKNKGITNQILGDGLMAVFGAPIPSKSHVLNSVESGYAIIEKIKSLADDQKIPPIKVGIGLHTGNVMAGNIGNAFRKQFSLTGSTVIISARIEQLNKLYKSQFLVSESVYQEIKSLKYEITSLGEEKLKGIEKPIGIYKLV